jgi:CrcB protein
VLAAVSLGGALGAVARYGISVLLVAAPGAWPWATFLTNVLGCLVLGALMVVLLEVSAPHRLARPFLGVGLIGGFTTFSTYAEETRALAADGHVVLATAYVAGSVIVGLVAVWSGARVARAAALRRRRL